MIQRRAAKYLQLDPQAKQKLDKDIDDYYAWHRRVMLPAYAVLCRRIAKGLRGGENFEENIHFVMPRVTELYQETLRPLAAPVAAAILTLDTHGQEELEKAFEEDNAEEKKRNLDDPVSARKRRAKRTLFYVREFSGDLTPQQEKRITEITVAFPMPVATWQAQREFHQGELMGLLRTNKNQSAIEASLLNWWLAPRTNTTDKDSAEMDDREVTRFFREILETLTPAQRENAAESFEAYSADFEELAQQSQR